ncbi:hypothetical protein Scep_021892 [Stephania cephalantha]|uniref:Uncharacterized protein n=1 Tax=Stephania cephalantha TaxID=152367 RepID=A0AAP0F9D3_9MAGN
MAMDSAGAVRRGVRRMKGGGAAPVRRALRDGPTAVRVRGERSREWVRGSGPSGLPSPSAGDWSLGSPKPSPLHLGEELKGTSVTTKDDNVQGYVNVTAKLQRRRQELTQTTPDQPVDDEAVYYKVASDCPKGCVYSLRSLWRKKRRYVDPDASTSQSTISPDVATTILQQLQQMENVLKIKWKPNSSKLKIFIWIHPGQIPKEKRHQQLLISLNYRHVFTFYASIMNPEIHHPLLDYLINELYPFGLQPEVAMQKNQIIILQLMPSIGPMPNAIFFSHYALYLAFPVSKSSNASESIISHDVATTILQQLQQMEKCIEDKMEAKLKQIEDLYSATSRTNSEGEATSTAPYLIELYTCFHPSMPLS